MTVITIDPGHGRATNRSPLDPTFFEGTSNYLFALELKRELERYEDVTVYMTRASVDDDPSLDARGRMAVENGSDVFLSIHSNASSNPSAYGVEGFFSVKTPEARALLEELCNAVKLNLPDSRIRRVTTKLSGDEDYYGVLRSSAGVKYSMIIEQGFHTNAGELECINSEEWRRTVAELQAKVFSDFFGLTKKEEAPEVTVKERTERIREYLQMIAEELDAIDQSE